VLNLTAMMLQRECPSDALLELGDRRSCVWLEVDNPMVEEFELSLRLAAAHSFCGGSSGVCFGA
jgi:hypothetical protein